MINSKQRLLLDEKPVGHKLVIDVDTRWNSTLYMLRRLLEQNPCLIALANEPSLSKSASTTIKNTQVPRYLFFYGGGIFSAQVLTLVGTKLTPYIGITL